MQNVINPAQLKEFDTLLCHQLGKDGFAIVPANHGQLFHVYEQNDYNCFPSFVTTDLYLQLYHLYFDCMLRELEENALLQLMTDFSYEMFQATDRMYTDQNDKELKALALHNAAFFSIAYQLFTGNAIGTPDQQALAQQEVQHVMKSENATSQFLKEYQDIPFPYSLFRPRGHYTRNEQLKHYFRGMMWLQTASFGLNSQEELKEAVMIAYALKDSKSVQQKYERLNRFITFLMGKSDNLSIPQVMAEVTKTGLDMQQLLNDGQALTTLGKKLITLGNQQIRIAPKFERTSHVKVCIIPQRYQPDAEVLQEMVDYDSSRTLRATPKGLDIFAAMGVSAAEQLLIAEGQQWKGFTAALDSMKHRMGEIDWQETMTTQWLQTVKTLTDKQSGKQLPYFMVTAEWDRKNLNAMLASWTELKHDAILYAKQPMGAECGGAGPPDPVTKGFVEPNTAFWQKAVDLLDNTYRLLKEENLLTKKTEEATKRLQEVVQFLLRISEKELASLSVTDEEMDQIKHIGATFENISLDLIREPNQYLMGWDDVQGTDRKVALVADVYTANADNNPDKSILYEAVGAADEIYVVVLIDGYLYLTRGAVLSYREFTEPIDRQRLTDEEWQQLLEKDARKGVPSWMKRITVPLKKTPVINDEIFYSSGC